MANVLPSSIGFHSRPHKDAPTFAFGLSSPMTGTQWSSVPAHQFSPFNQFASSSNHNTTTRSQKRRLDSDDGSENSQEHMDRSPTPDRPKRALVKRARTSPAASEIMLRDDRRSKEERTQTRNDQDVDIGVLLARLPSHSLLPILTTLIERHPGLKNEILSLIPPPTLETAVHELMVAGKKLRDAYPHSNATQPNPLGFGFGFGSTPNHLQSTLNAQHQSTGMRDEYILSRIRPVLAEFVSAFSTYMPYFSYTQNHTTHSMQSQTSRSAQCHPTEAFRFLSVVNDQICEQPLLVQSALESDLRDRLTTEWNGWLHKVDTIVNHEGGMFGSETATGWIRYIDQYAGSDRHSAWITTLYKNLGHNFVMKIGWLAQRQPVYRMEES